jgi:transcription elongation GreA/GreB family factor
MNLRLGEKCDAIHPKGIPLVGVRPPLQFCGSGSWREKVQSSRAMKKAQLLRLIVASLLEKFEVLERAARTSHGEATHESSKADNKYDTRGLEAAYLARGQSRQAKEILDSIEAYNALPTKEFTPNDAIDMTALVELDLDGTRSAYFIGPLAGGIEIRHGREEVVVITPQSPLGQALMGKKAGARWTAKQGGHPTKFHIVSVS